MEGELLRILATNLRERRLHAGLTQEALADATGLHRTYIGAVERQERNISIRNLERLAAALGVAAADLLQEYRRGN
jgi:transcriptional regulator with XRE-family HTH domain